MGIVRVLIPLQPMFDGLRLLFATRAFKVNCRAKLTGVSREEGARLFSNGKAVGPLECGEGCWSGCIVGNCCCLLRTGIRLLIANRWLGYESYPGRATNIATCFINWFY